MLRSVTKRGTVGGVDDGDANNVRLDLVVLVLALAIFLFATPFTAWWASAGLPWYAPFLLWAVLIAAVALQQRLERRHGD